MRGFGLLYITIFIVFGILAVVNADCSTRTSCGKCVKARSECVWCEFDEIPANTTERFGCVSGSPIGPDKKAFCKSWYWGQCDVNGHKFDTDFTYVVILALIVFGAIVILTVGIFLCCKYCGQCTCGGSDDDDDYEMEQRSKRRKDEHYETQRKEKLNEILNDNKSMDRSESKSTAASTSEQVVTRNQTDDSHNQSTYAPISVDIQVEQRSPQYAVQDDSSGGDDSDDHHEDVPPPAYTPPPNYSPAQSSSQFPLYNPQLLRPQNGSAPSTPPPQRNNQQQYSQSNSESESDSDSDSVSSSTNSSSEPGTPPVEPELNALSTDMNGGFDDIEKALEDLKNEL